LFGWRVGSGCSCHRA